LSESDATGGANAPVLEQEVPESQAPESQAGDAASASSPETPDTGSSDNGDGDEPGDRGDGPVVLDDLGGQSFSDAVDATIVEFDDGDIVTGTVVKIDSDEVLLDIGYKSEGVIPSRELSIRNEIGRAHV